MNTSLQKTLLSLVIFVGALLLYIQTAPHGMIYDGGLSVDSAELQRVANRLGIAHSTGYPLYTVLGYGAARLGEWLADAPYTWITYFSGVMSAAALVLMFHAGVLVGSIPAALGAVAVLAVGNIFWHMSTIAEVQGLHAFIVAAMLYLALYTLKHPQAFWPVGLMALLAGFGLSNHRMIVLVFPAVGVALLLGRFWRHQWKLALIVVLSLLPLLSYLYIYWRATDPFVVYGTRLTWIPVQLSTIDMTNLIRGTFQDGQGLEANIVFNLSTFGERLSMIWGRIVTEVALPGALLGMTGLGVLLVKRWRDGLVLSVYLITLVVFLVGWQVDDKARIYTYLLVMPLALGGVALFSFSPRFGFIPLFLLAGWLYQQNYPLRNMSDDTRTAEFITQLQQLPEDSLFYTGVWQPELFITLEYLDEHQKNSPIPAGTNLWWVPLDDMRDTNKTVVIGQAWRSLYGLYGGATWFQEENGIAFSGTNTPLFLQARPANDPRLEIEADTAVRAKLRISPEIELYSYDLNATSSGMEITIYWRALTDVQESYSVYTHLRFYEAMCNLDYPINLLGQDDSSAPVHGAYPTQLWQKDQLVKDTYFIPWRELPLQNAGLALAFGMTTNGARTEELCLPLDSNMVGM